MATLPDLTKLTHEQLLAYATKLSQKKAGPAMAWAKNKEGEALTLTFPGKRSRYLEVEELQYIIEHGDALLEEMLGMMQ